ncbi:MAG: hypothetical protein R3E75_03185 [Steroidobacteraceae bacterium]|nr:hypothetical protein [Nevskiaceae bacterium]MCP5467126.1 hypothetical protein [Nevskiaceae bacterium]MCP5472045.1 hypothetical protein [Nevskiaceae bacterium]
MVFDSYFLLKLAHILLFVYWLGGDIGVFYSAFQVRDRHLSADGRRTALKILVWVDQIPRYCLVLMLPVGYTLALRLGVVRMPSSFVVILWAVALVWLWAVWAIHHYQGTALGERVRRTDLVWRYVLLFGLLFDAWRGFSGQGHLLVDWISLKFLLFAAMLFCGIMIRTLGKPSAPALRQIFTTGSTPELEAIVQRTAARTRPFVLGIWVLLVIAAYVGISKPDFGFTP